MKIFRKNRKMLINNKIIQAHKTAAFLQFFYFQISRLLHGLLFVFLLNEKNDLFKALETIFSALVCIFYQPILC